MNGRQALDIKRGRVVEKFTLPHTDDLDDPSSSLGGRNLTVRASSHAVHTEMGQLVIKQANLVVFDGCLPAPIDLYNLLAKGPSVIIFKDLPSELLQEFPFSDIRACSRKIDVFLTPPHRQQ